MIKEQSPNTSSSDGEGVNETIQGPELIVYMRKVLGLSQAKLAEGSGITQGAICDLEAGKLLTEPSYRTSINLAKMLGIGIHFWEDGLTDTYVFLNPQARIVNLIANHANPSPIKTALLAYVDEAIPVTENPNIAYIEHYPTYTRIGDKIADYRDELRIPQWEMASNAELSQGYLSHLEDRKGRKEKNPTEVKPSLGRLIKIADALNTVINDLLDIREVRYPEIVVRVDRFFRSSEVQTETKKETWTTISSLIKQAGHPILFSK